MSDTSEAGGVAPVSVGEKQMDAEHAVQLQLLNAVAQAIEEGRSVATAELLFQQFLDYSDAHFVSEQIIMRFHGYPGYDLHIQEHDRLMNQARQIQEGIITGKRPVNLELVRELREWLLGHMTGEDEAFGAYLAEKERMVL